MAQLRRPIVEEHYFLTEGCVVLSFEILPSGTYQLESGARQKLGSSTEAISELIPSSTLSCVFSFSCHICNISINRSKQTNKQTTWKKEQSLQELYDFHIENIEVTLLWELKTDDAIDAYLIMRYYESEQFKEQWKLAFCLTTDNYPLKFTDKVFLKQEARKL